MNNEVEKSRCDYCQSDMHVEAPFGFIPSSSGKREDDWQALDICWGCLYKLLNTFERFFKWHDNQTRRQALQERTGLEVTPEKVQWMIDLFYKLTSVVHRDAPRDGGSL